MNEWKGKSKEFLESQDEKIDIEPILVQYHDQFMSTQNKIYIGMVAENSNELTLLVSSMEQLLKPCFRRSEMTKRPLCRLLKNLSYFFAF